VQYDTSKTRQDGQREFLVIGFPQGRQQPERSLAISLELVDEVVSLNQFAPDGICNSLYHGWFRPAVANFAAGQ
jgi:hypothetical protein